MRTKDEILGEVQEALTAGVISEADLAVFVKPQPAVVAPASPNAPESDNKPDKLTAVDVMFYVAGIVLFATVMSLIVQSWEADRTLMNIALSAGIGSLMWVLAAYLIKAPTQNDIRKGLFNSLLLTGSLSLIVGGYIVLNQILGGYDELNLIATSVALLVLAGLHFGFDRLVKRDFTLLMTILLGAAAFPVFMFGILRETDMPFDVYVFILILTGVLLAYATRVIGKIYPDRTKIRRSFDGLGTFLALGSMFAASFGNYGALWLGAMFVSVMLLFYLSIVSQNKHLLGNGAFFMVVTVITISFKYFSGFGVTTSLVLSTIGLLGSAGVAATINRKYFKKTTDAPAQVR